MDTEREARRLAVIAMSNDSVTSVEIASNEDVPNHAVTVYWLRVCFCYEGYTSIFTEYELNVNLLRDRKLA